jgi:HSP20 family protein
MTHIFKKSTFPMWQGRDEFITPFSAMFNDIVEQHFPEFKKDFAIDFNKGTFPKVDAIDRPDAVTIVAEVAGWKKEDISIDVENGILTISGNNVIGNKPLEDGTYIIKELKRSNFERSFRLTDKLDEERIDASFINGVLVITIKKKVEEPAIAKKSIDIKNIQVD